MKKHILLHACCAPCSPYAVEFLKKEGFEVTLYFYGPNIQPIEEYEFRLEEIKRFAFQVDVTLVVGKYDIKDWTRFTSGLEAEPEGGKRCEACFAMRLQKTATLCKERNEDGFSTVLTVSPHKKSSTIFEIGKTVANEQEIIFYDIDFKKNNGFIKSVELAKKWKLKRQNYCGCLYSRRKKG